jgi:endonuclease YncB( thermonuclease family)
MSVSSIRSHRPFGLALLSACLVLPAASCFGGSKASRRLQKSEIQARLKAFETPGLLIGEFPLARGAVVDGDTIKVAGLDSSLRLLAIDTEETFKSEQDRRLFEVGFEQYLKAKRGKSLKPVKAATPLGEEAKQFALKFFEGVNTARLERDHPKEIRGRFNRYLAYVFVRKQGEWVNYNIECVRAGMSPYFTKYAYSRRFHDQFVAAQKEAQHKRLGIWDPSRQHYPDYPERLEWWNARADFIRAFEIQAEGKSNYIVLTNWDALRLLEQNEGKQVVVLGTVGDIKLGDRGPTRVMLSRRLLGDFPLVFFDKDVFGNSQIAKYAGEFVVVTGTISRYRDKRKKRDELQMVINLPGQVVGSERVPDYSGWDTEGREELLELQVEEAPAVEQEEHHVP